MDRRMEPASGLQMSKMKMLSISLNKYYGNVRGLKNDDVEISITMLVIVELWATIAIPSLSALHNVSI